MSESKSIKRKVGNSNITEDEIQQIADLIRILYVKYLRKKSPRWRHYTPGARQATFFRKAAELCLQNHLDPDAHVRALINSVEVPHPYMLLGKQALVRTKLFTRSEAKNDFLDFKAQLANLDNRLKTGESLEDILNGPSGDLSPAFRYVVALEAGLFDLAKTLKPAAKAELRFRPKFKELLEQAMPNLMEYLNDGFDAGSDKAFGNTFGA